MPAHQVSISVDGVSHNIVPGLVQGNILLALAPISPSDQLLFEVDGDIDIPISPTDFIVLKGGETFSIGDGCPRISDNPSVRKAVSLVVNQCVSDHEHHPQHAKLTGAEIKGRAGTPPAEELWLDLKGLADEHINDAHRLILREGYTFFTRALDSNEGCECTQQGSKFVHISVNAVKQTILAGNYLVVDLKILFSIPTDYEFVQVTGGKFSNLSNEAVISICGGEVFVGHVRQGASS